MKRPHVIGSMLAVSTAIAAIAAVVLSGVSPVPLAAQAQPALVIDGGTLIDGNGGAPVADAVVVVQGNRITAVGRRGQTTIPAGAQVIRADGKFILPGLWDSQVSYNWYYAEPMLNSGITSTIDVGIAGEIAKGSGRSVPGVDLGAAVIAAGQAGILLNGGGHPMAAGFTVQRSRLAELAEFLRARIAPSFRESPGLRDLALDGALATAAATPALLERLEGAGPFGAGNAEPRFAVPAAAIVKADPVGDGHVRVILGGGNGGGRLKAIAFRSLDTPVGQALLSARGMAMHLAGHLRADTWQGRTEAQLVIEDAAPVA